MQESLSKIMVDRETQSLILVSALLASVSIATYPYIPDEGVAFYAVFTFLGYLGYRKTSLDSVLGTFFAAFSVTVLAVRAFVNQAGIATPGSEGSIGFLEIQQIWLGGLHVHHWYAGVAVLSFCSLPIYRREKPGKFLYMLSGLGAALIVDEAGIILAGHTYHSWISYVALLVFQIAFLWSFNREDRSFYEKLNKVAVLLR